jgi:ssDNA-binding Zn-finger/Zn-ribbon topoisomerase 1
MKNGQNTMKAHLIISEEYRMNQPSVFIFANGKYYGCQNYPKIKDYPEDVDYWKVATSSDADRGFSVKEVDYSNDVFAKIQSLQDEIFETSKLLKPEPVYSHIPKPDATKNSKVYTEYLAKLDNQNNQERECYEYNKPHYAVISAKRNELRELLLSVCSNNEN